jgi:hypothetical protein
MFETRDIIYTADEYGASNNDLTFVDIAAATYSTKFNKPHPSVTLALEVYICKYTYSFMFLYI